MQIYKELKQDHEKIKSLLSDIEDTTERATAKRPELLAELKSLLLAHSRAEEDVFYSALKKESKTRADALEGYEEHNLAERLLKELEQGDPSDEKWTAKFKVLKENLEHHIKEEEEEIFAHAKEVVSKDEAEEMGESFVEERDQLMH